MYPVPTDAVYNQPLSVKAVQCPYQSCRHGQSHSLPACHGCCSRSAESRRHLCSKSKTAEYGSYHWRCIQCIRGLRLRMGYHSLRDARYCLRHHDLYAENSPAPLPDSKPIRPKNNVSTSSLRKEVFLLRDTHDKTPLERGAFISYKPRFLFPYLHHMFLPILQEDCPIFPIPCILPHHLPN